MIRMRIPLLLWAGAAMAACAPAPAASRPSPEVSPPALDRIREGELRRDLFALAGDAMRGREAGTLDELRAAAWVAERAREAGLEPAGEDGTYFQFFPVRRTRLSGRSHLAIGDDTLEIWREAVVLSPVDAQVDAPIVFVGEGRETDLRGVDLRGKVVAAVLSAPENAPPLGRGLTARRYAMLAVRQRAALLTGRGAAAVLLISDPVAEGEYENIAAGWARGEYALANEPAGAAARPPVIWARRSYLERVRAPGARLAARLVTESFEVPSANVVARVPGSDPALRGEHLLYSAHHDGLGVRFPWAGDSIWNGADDNATTSVALLAIGRAFASRPGRRSALFVWHGSEELYLFGSRWYVQHPTVARESIVAVLNGDMIGGNHPDTAALLGAVPPHRSSTTLVRMALEANARTARFVIDTSWDDPSHPENFFFRSDHLPYLRVGIPAVYFSTLLHPDYHTPEDEPERIHYPKLTRMTRWMYATGWAVANAATRPGADPGFRLER
jgi:hypothetical protein